MQNEYLPLSRLCREIPGAKGADRLLPSALTPWILRGVKGTTGTVSKLRAIRVGGRWLTTRDWFNEFLDSLSSGSEPHWVSHSAR
jgi:hypothetical protein